MREGADTAEDTAVMEVMREGADTAEDTAVEEVMGADTEEDHTSAREGVEKDLAKQALYPRIINLSPKFTCTHLKLVAVKGRNREERLVDELLSPTNRGERRVDELLSRFFSLSTDGGGVFSASAEQISEELFIPSWADTTFEFSFPSLLSIPLSFGPSRFEDASSAALPISFTSQGRSVSVLEDRLKI
nr:hypothetical protein Iba_chr15bCG1780 [Ipomoea batatas]